MAANFKWTTPGISNLCNNMNKNKFTYCSSKKEIKLDFQHRMYSLIDFKRKHGMFEYSIQNYCLPKLGQGNLLKKMSHEFMGRWCLTQIRNYYVLWWHLICSGKFWKFNKVEDCPLKILKIPEAVRTDNIMAKRKTTKGHWSTKQC